jgi:hypothetical protein
VPKTLSAGQVHYFPLEIKKRVRMHDNLSTSPGPNLVNREAYAGLNSAFPTVQQRIQCNAGPFHIRLLSAVAPFWL